MSDIKDEKPPKFSTHKAEAKVPGSQPHNDWIRVGFFFALGVFGLAIAAFSGLKLLNAIITAITPFIAGYVLALLLDPLVDRLERRRMHRSLAVAIVFILFVGTIILLAVVAIPAVVNQASALAANGPLYVGETKTLVNKFLIHHRSIFSIHMPKNFDVLSAQVSGQVAGFLQRSAGGFTVVLVGGLSTIIDIIISVIVGFYLLLDIDRLRARFYFLMPELYRKTVAEYSLVIAQVFSGYLRGMLIVCALYGIGTIVMLYGLAYMPKYGCSGIAQYALLIGCAAGVLYAVPYLGAFTTGIVTFIVAFATGGPQFGFIAIAATVVINQTFDNIVAPRIIGGGVGLNPVLAIFTLSVGGYLFGFWGLLFAMPVTASIQGLLFKMLPKLTRPTPHSFLAAHGVMHEQGETAQIPGDAPDNVERKTAAKREAEHEHMEDDVAKENAEAPG